MSAAPERFWYVGDDDGEGGGVAYLKRSIVENDEVDVTPRMYVELEVWNDDDGRIAKRCLTVVQTERLIRALGAAVATVKAGKGFVQ